MAVLGDKKCKTGKNKKKSWRKFSNVKDVEDFLDDKREDDRMGGNPAEKSSHCLFFLEKTPVKLESRTVLSKAERRNRALKCHQSLLPKSHVPAITTQRSGPSSKKKKISANPKDEEISANQQDQVKSNNLKPSSDATFDLWDDIKNEPTEEKDVDPEIVEHFERSTCKKPAVVPDHIFMKPSLLPSVEVPHPGASYNPGFEDHQELLLEAHKIEFKTEKAEQRIERSMAKKIVATERELQDMWLQEMSQGLAPNEDGDGADGEGEAGTSTSKAVTNEKRKKKRKRQLEQEQRELEAKKQKLERAKMSDVFRIKSIRKEIAQEEAKSAVRQAKKRQKIIESMYKPKKLSKYKYEDPDVEIKLSDELNGSLRLLKAEGSIIEDRYKSLQRRNIIEPRIKQKMKRKYKLKAYVKRSHKD